MNLSRTSFLTGRNTHDIRGFDFQADTLVIIDGIELLKFINFKIRLDMGIFDSWATADPAALCAACSLRPGLYVKRQCFRYEADAPIRRLCHYRGCASGPSSKIFFPVTGIEQTNPVTPQPPSSSVLASSSGNGCIIQSVKTIFFGIIHCGLTPFLDYNLYASASPFPTSSRTLFMPNFCRISTAEHSGIIHVGQALRCPRLVKQVC